jgi:hypothetical protein
MITERNKQKGKVISISAVLPAYPAEFGQIFPEKVVPRIPYKQ